MTTHLFDVYLGFSSIRTPLFIPFSSTSFSSFNGSFESDVTAALSVGVQVSPFWICKLNNFFGFNEFAKLFKVANLQFQSS